MIACNEMTHVDHVVKRFPRIDAESGARMSARAYSNVGASAFTAWEP
jgi:hypothetical protein